MEVTTRHKWTLTQGAFDKLLASLDEDRERAGRAYEELRGHLVRLFQWRGCPFPEDHADETLNRVARRIEAGEDIRDVKGEGGAKINSRKKLAQSLSLSINTLRMRALRLREKLEACVKACVGKAEA